MALALAVLSFPLGPPHNADDICSIFSARRSWHRHTQRVAARWQVSEALQMALIEHESGYRSAARPPRRKILWILPGPRPSTAFGYAQVLDATWAQFQAETGRSRAKRHRFADAAHFIGWYVDQLSHLTGVARDDAYNIYLAYHEGPGGYLRGSYRDQPWLLAVAKKVARQAGIYRRQYAACQDQLRSIEIGRRIALLLIVAGALAAWAHARRRDRRRRTPR